MLGVGVQTLHFYERRRLIPLPVRSASGYRL
ncbi:MAG: MerR family DNA-binding transcriptional regulator [Gemmatimonadetes bacterium]|nr:MerR family DNA-binding transcriptional regulator [Gemmatimonadota bacterium]